MIIDFISKLGCEHFYNTTIFSVSYGPEGFGGYAYCDTSATNGYLLPENVTPLYLQWGILVTGFDFIFVLRLSLFSNWDVSIFITPPFSVYPDKISYGPEGFGGYCDTSATNQNWDVK